LQGREEKISESLGSVIDNRGATLSRYCDALGRLADMSETPSISRSDVANLAKLARIEMTESELDHLSSELAVILNAVARVSEVAKGEIAPTSHPLPLVNVFREDQVAPSLTQEEALSGAPAKEEGRFKVPQILGEEA
jgi:aspartyl-tRNA(Asn)/glutamyl-tRNA(Gln) amidotransferase subunit C